MESVVPFPNFTDLTGRRRMPGGTMPVKMIDRVGELRDAEIHYHDGKTQCR